MTEKRRYSDPENFFRDECVFSEEFLKECELEYDRSKLMGSLASERIAHKQELEELKKELDSLKKATVSVTVVDDPVEGRRLMGDVVEVMHTNSYIYPF